jgi:hypothetical protein
LSPGCAPRTRSTNSSRCCAGPRFRCARAAPGGNDAAELRTEENLKIRLFTSSSIERMVDDYENSSAGNAASEQTSIRSVVIDRSGRAASVSVLEPRAWAILRCVVLDMEEMSVGRRESSAELVSAVARMIQDRWPEPFAEEQIHGFGPLRDALEGEEFFPPPRI